MGGDTPAFRLSIAPMMDRTDAHYRWMMRRITRRTWLYTEMVTAQALVHGDRQRLLAMEPCEHPVAVQLGGDDPAALARCAAWAAEAGFDEVNLNCGCPSPKVARQGRFGAALMLAPDHTARIVEAMCHASAVPVTVKCRLGVDEADSYEHLLTFARAVVQAGCARLIVHARKAWLHGLDPRANRTVPPLRPEAVWQLASDLAPVPVELNGGIRTLDAALAHRGRVAGVMIGRAAWDDPMLFARADGGSAVSPVAVARAMCDRLEAHLRAGGKPHPVLRPMSNLFRGRPGARAWRQMLAEAAHDAHPPDAVRRWLDRYEHRIAA